jgi:hypothetical protein
MDKSWLSRLSNGNRLTYSSAASAVPEGTTPLESALRRACSGLGLVGKLTEAFLLKPSELDGRAGIW